MRMDGPQPVSVVVLFSQSGTQPKHQLNSFDFPQPIRQRSGKFIFVGGDDSRGTGRAQLSTAMARYRLSVRSP